MLINRDVICFFLERFLCVVESHVYCIDWLLLKIKVSPFTIPALLGNTASGVIGIECGCQGPNYGITSACASGGHAIGKKISLIF